MAIGGTTLMILVLVSGRARELQWVNWRDAFFFGGVILAVSTTLLVTAQDYADPVSIAIISSGIPVVSLFIGYLMGSEGLSARKIIAIAFAVAGGIELALWCDMRVAAEGAAFGVFCRRFGVPLIDLGTVRLPRLIGHSRAMDLILTGRPVAAKEAVEIGLANRLTPKDGALGAALELAKDLAALPQTCMRHDRLSALEQWDLSEDAALSNEMRLGVATISSGETASGAAAFTQGAGRGGQKR